MKRTFLIAIYGAVLIIGCLSVVAWQTQQNFGSGLPAGLTYGAPVFTVSQAGTGNGQVCVAGNTSGSACFTAPSTAGTAANPIVSSNALQLPSGTTYGISTDTCLSRDSGGVYDVGNCTPGDTSGTLQASIYGRGAAAASPNALTFQGQSGTGSNIAGGNVSLQPGAGTGNAAGTQLNMNRDLVAGSGSSAQSQANALTVCESKSLSTTSATAQTIAIVNLASNSAGGAEGSITVSCSDGTNFDSETQDFTVSYVNKAGVLTLGTPAITTSTAANNSGSCTIGMTAVAGTNQVLIKVTPVFSTIVPTSVTEYAEFRNHGAGAVACQ